MRDFIYRQCILARRLPGLLLILVQRVPCCSPQHHQSGYATNQPQRTAHQTWAHRRCTVQRILGGASGSNISVQAFLCGRQTGLCCNLHLRPAGCRHGLLCTVHGCPCPRRGNLRPPELCFRQCHFITCCRHKSCRGRHRSGGHIAKVPGNPDGNQRPRGCCHIINITGNTVQHAGERFCHPAGFIRATHPGHKGVFHLCDPVRDRFRHGGIFITQYPQLAD